MFYHPCYYRLRNDPELAGLATSLMEQDDNKRNVMAAVRSAGKHAWKVIREAADGLKNDRDIVMAAVRSAGKYAWMVIREAGDGPKNDPAIVMAAVRSAWPL